MSAGRLLLLPILLYAAWLAMMAVHELGHVFHAWASGGVVAAVRVPPVGFSVTEYAVNPRPHFVAWGGAVWGSVLPLIAWGAAVLARMNVRAWLKFFAGFCLVANGAYLGVGWVTGAGDAGELLAYGTPRWVLIAVGLIATAGGLLLWHTMGPLVTLVAPERKRGGPGRPAP